MARLLLQKQSHLCMNLIFFCSAISYGLPEVCRKKLKCGVRLDIYCLYLWCTKRVKSTDTGRPLFQKYGSTRKDTGDPYFTSLLAFTGRTVKYESTYNLRVDPCVFPERN